MAKVTPHHRTYLMCVVDCFFTPCSRIVCSVARVAEKKTRDIECFKYKVLGPCKSCCLMSLWLKRQCLLVDLVRALSLLWLVCVGSNNIFYLKRRANIHMQAVKRCTVTRF